MDEEEDERSSSGLSSCDSDFIQECARMALQDGGPDLVEASDDEDDEDDDEEELAGAAAKGAKRARAGATAGGGEGHKHYVKWGEINKGGPRERERFSTAAGVSKLPAHMRDGVDRDPLAYFELFFTQEMQNRVVQKSNRYVADMQEKKEADPAYNLPKWAQTWKELDGDELRVWIGLILLKGVSHTGDEETFFTTKPLLRRPIVNACMSRRRFLSIKRALHCQDDDEAAEWEGQPRKIGILMDMFLGAAQDVYVVDENCACDEMILKFKGTSRMKFQRLAKPTREGLKIFAMCESGTGYVVAALLDQRSKKTIEDTVMDLVQVIQGKWRVVYMDNLFTSASLLRKMLLKKTYGAGTVRAGRGLPLALEKKSAALKEPGDYLFVQGDGGLLGAVWRDSGNANAMSNFHDGAVTTLKRRVKGHAERQDRVTLDVFADYNKHMGAMDLADMKRAWHTCRLRAFKWWHPLFYWILDSVMINASIVHKKHKNSKMPNSSFWLAVIEGLLESRLVGGLDASAKQLEEETAAAKRGQGCGFDAKRLKGRHYLAHLPLEGTSKKACRLCAKTFGSKDKRSKSTTVWWCEQCKIPLRVECFKSFHEDANPKSGFFE